jgi:hypothetical protein
MCYLAKFDGIAKPLDVPVARNPHNQSLVHVSPPVLINCCLHHAFVS